MNWLAWIFIGILCAFAVELVSIMWVWWKTRDGQWIV